MSTGESATGHLMVETTYPDALDHWATVHPGFGCAVELVGGEWTETRRPTTDAERADLIRRFACTYESIREHHPC